MGDAVQSDWNQNEIWSDYFDAESNKERAFDGNLTTYSYQSPAGGTSTFTYTGTGLSGTLRVYYAPPNVNNGEIYQIQGQPAVTWEYPDTGWVTVGTVSGSQLLF